MPRQAYAPTPHSYVPNTAMSATINLDEEVKLADTRAERDLQDSLAEIFSIIVTIDELEKAFLKDAIPEADYTEICERSLKQYRSILADETVAAAFGDLEEFKAEWDVSLIFPFSRPLFVHMNWRQFPLTSNAMHNSSRCLAPLSASESACPPQLCRHPPAQGPATATARAACKARQGTARAAHREVRSFSRPRRISSHSSTRCVWDY